MAFCWEVLPCCFCWTHKPEVAIAARDGDIDKLKYLISIGKRVDSIDSTTFDPRSKKFAIHEAAIGGHNECVMALIDAGADLNVQDRYVPQPLEFFTGLGRSGHRTALSFAAEKGHAKTFEILLDAGADIHLNGLNGSILEYAVEGNNEEIVKKCLEMKVTDDSEHMKFMISNIERHLDRIRSEGEDPGPDCNDTKIKDLLTKARSALETDSSSSMYSTRPIL
jgi:ankyrin repeat protein